MRTVVVTRHKALVDLLIERGLINPGASVVEHATVDDVRGAHVIGVLPLKLCCEAETVTEIPLSLSPEQRGRELTLDELRDVAGPAVTYVVHRVTDGRWKAYVAIV